MDHPSSTVVFALLGALLLTLSALGILMAGRRDGRRFAQLAYRLSWVGLVGSVVLVIVSIAFVGRDRLVDNDLVVPGLGVAVVFAIIGVSIRARLVANSPS
jgi:hypothetical protein